MLAEDDYEFIKPPNQMLRKHGPCDPTRRSDS